MNNPLFIIAFFAFIGYVAHDIVIVIAQHAH